MSTLPVKRNDLLVIPTLVFVLGFVLIVAGVVVEFVGRPEHGGRSYSLYLFVMRSGVLVLLLGMCSLLVQCHLQSLDRPTGQDVAPRKT